MRFRPIVLSALLAACTLCACTASEGALERVADARARNDGPAMWVVEDADSTLYLYGTVHIVPAGLDWQRDDLWEAFARAGTVWFEVPSTPDAQATAERLTRLRGYQPPGGSLSGGFDAYELRLLEVAALQADVPFPVLDSLRPWLASELLTLAAAEDAGLSAALAPDEAIKSRARRSAKYVTYLDRLEDQIALAADAPEQGAALREVLEGYNRLGAELAAIAAEWVSGDVEGLAARLADSITGEARERLMTERNAKWAATLADWMEGSGNGLAVVGVGHLVGEDSLLDALEREGFAPRRHYSFQGGDVLRTIELDVDTGGPNTASDTVETP